MKPAWHRSCQAVETITADQIRDSGAFRMADVLRMATALQVYIHMGHLADCKVPLSDSVLKIARKF